MGGGSSISLQQKQAAESILDIDVMQPEEGALTRQMLDTLARKNFSPSKRRKGSYTRMFSSPVAPAVVLPKATVELLQRIGIKDAEIEAKFGDNKSKLVTHIFDCLGALQSLVHAADLTSPDENLETQSVIERDEQAMGKLLHEMVNISFHVYTNIFFQYDLLSCQTGINLWSLWRYYQHSFVI